MGACLRKFCELTKAKVERVRTRPGSKWGGTIPSKSQEKGRVLPEVNGNAGDDSVATVFQDKHLREKIIRHALFPACPQARSSTTKSLRLVSHDWFRSVSNVYSALGTPLLYLHGNDLQIRRNFCENAKLPLELATGPDFFDISLDAPKLLSLSHDAPNIVKWSMSFSYATKFPKALPIPALPCLHTLEASFSPDWSERTCDARKTCRNLSSLLQQVFSLSRNLKSVTLKLVYPSWEPLPLIDLHFTTLKLPESISNLVLAIPLRPQQCAAFFKQNNFPRLTFLTLKLVRYDGEMFYKLIKKVKDSLEHLTLFGRKDMSAVLRFPVMPRLKTLDLIGGPWLWDPARVSDTPENVFMSLTTLNFQNMANGNAATRWTNKSIQRLRTELADSYFWRSSIGICVLHQNFPNVNVLRVKICGVTATQQVEYLWSNWNQLEELTLDIYGTGFPMKIGPHYWDALITGLPLRKTKELRDNPLWEDKQGILAKCGPSIRNLKRLKRFSLLNIGSRRDIKNVRLVTHVSFELAFMLMPSLEEVKFSGKFQPCPVLLQLWKERSHGALSKINA